MLCSNCGAAGAELVVRKLSKVGRRVERVRMRGAEVVLLLRFLSICRSQPMFGDEGQCKMVLAAKLRVDPSVAPRTNFLLRQQNPSLKSMLS